MEDGIDRTPKGLAASMNSPSFSLARERMKKKAALLKQAGAPREGIWYWVFLNPDWKLITWDAPTGGDVLHAKVWSDVVNAYLTPHYKLDPASVAAAKALPYAMPRGRISSETLDGGKKYFFVRHGEDTPVPNGLHQVEEKFNLITHMLEGMAEELYDPHETVVKNEVAEMQRLIGAEF
jgi:hypothetical protein